MSATTNRRRGRPATPVPLEASREAKRVAALILEVLAGTRTPPQAAEALATSLSRYYQFETRGLKGLLAACEPKGKGRQANPLREMAEIQRENERLRQEVARQHALLRLSQRSVGLSPPPPPAPKQNGKKTRKRKPVVRSLALAARLNQEAEAPDAPSDNGMSPSPS